MNELKHYTNIIKIRKFSKNNEKSKKIFNKRKNCLKISYSKMMKNLIIFEISEWTKNLEGAKDTEIFLSGLY